MKECERICQALKEGVRCVLLRGAAGTGKTTLVRDLLPHVQMMGCHPILLAPTGRAAKVLELRTGRKARTVHAAIYDVPSEPTWDAEQESWRWHFGIQKTIPAGAVIIVDEASLVGRTHQADENLVFGTGSLLDDLIRWSGVGLPECTNRIVFVGDAYQLPPVGDPLGTPPALDPDVVSDLVGQRPLVVELTEVRRQERTSGILDEAMRLRACLVLKNYGSFSYRPHDDVSFIGEDQVREAYHAEVGLDRKVILAQTNARVWDYNQMVRAALGRTNAEPVPGDRLLSLRNTTVGNAEDGLMFRNGELLEVTAVASRRLVLEGFYRVPGSQTTLRYSFVFRKMSIRWTAEPNRGEGTCWVNVSPIASEAWRLHDRSAPVALFVAVRKWIQERHAEEFSSLDAEARRLRLRELLRQSVLLHAPIVTYGYALTVHKAQGGDWDEVWVDCRYAGRPNSEEYFRWMYTATTRAKRKLVVVEAPRIDDLVEALSNGIERMEREGVAEDNVPEHPVRNLGDVLGTGGYLLRRCVERDWVHRCFVGHAGSDLECGWIDVGYNGKKTVTHLSIHIDDLAESVRKDLLALKGLPMNRVMGSERRPETPEKGLPEICVVPQHELVANRLCVAAHGRLTILSVTSKGPFLLRMTLRTERRVAFVDCYFDGKGVVTKMGNATLPLEDLRALRDGLTAKKKERNVQDDA